jgi:hypothetical protein
MKNLEPAIKVCRFRQVEASQIYNVAYREQRRLQQVCEQILLRSETAAESDDD